jgi:hypothetical protein
MIIMTPNNRWLSLVAAAAIAGTTLLSSTASATVAQAVPFEEKVDNAAGIVLGRVVSTRSQMDPTGRWIVTYSTMRVEKAMKGQPSSEVTIVMPGGHVGNLNQSTIGIPAFREGDERVVFLKQTKLGPTVLYFDQGAYDVMKDERGERIVTPVQSDAVHIDTQRGVAVASEEPRTLKEFESAVAAAIKSRPQRVEMGAVNERARQQQQKNGSVADFLRRNKVVIAIAAIGAALAMWQLLRK